MTAAPVRILLISGALRAGSVHTAALRTAAALDVPGVDAVLYDDVAALPHFNPDDDPMDGTPPAPVVALRGALAGADALLFSTPEYAGALPGAFKNLLDWTVGTPDMDGMPVAWINASGVAAPTGGADAHESLRKVLGYLNAAIVEEACVRVPVARAMVGDDGTVTDPDTREALRAALDALQAAARGAPSDATT